MIVAESNLNSSAAVRLCCMQIRLFPYSILIQQFVVAQERVDYYKWETRYSLNMVELDKVISPSRRHAIGASQTNKSHLSGPDKSITLPVKSLHCCPEFPFYTQYTCQDKHLNVIFAFHSISLVHDIFCLRYVSWSNHTFRIIERFLVGYVKQQNCARLASVCLDWMHYYDFLGI